MNQIDVSPQGCADRKARIEAAGRAELKRKQKLTDSRALVRSAQLTNAWEFLACLTNASASVKSVCPITNDYAARLLELITDLDAELREGEPELSSLPYSGRERGEYDVYTRGVRNRSAE